MMEEYILFKGEIQGRYREIEIYPFDYSSQEYLIHWDGFEIGIIKKIDQTWYSEADELKPVVAEIGIFIDSYGVKPD
jgi:hypothetical protein